MAGLEDPRQPQEPTDITYPLPALLFEGVLMFLCRLGARRQVGFLLRNEVAARTFETLFGVAKVAHGDTMNNVLCALRPEAVQEMVCAMTETLIRKKLLSVQRLLGKYYCIAIDGTGTLTYRDRHCPYCLTRTKDGKTTYYHNVLEAKLVTQNGFAFSIMSEFIENTEEGMTKQDCELKAFYRLAPRLKARFQKLPIALLLDGLFAGGPVFGLCRRLGWRFLIGLKDDDLKTVNEEFESLCALEAQNHLVLRTGKDGCVAQQFRWANGISYVDTKKQEHELAVLESKETKPAKNGEEKTTTFRWLSNFSVKTNNAIELANQGGRLRWKVENEGFNIQKNGGYELEHAYTQDETGIKVYYYLLQIACMLAQLIEKGSLLKKAFPNGLGSAKNTALFLLEAWRNRPLHPDDYQAIIRIKIQIRFDTS